MRNPHRARDLEHLQRRLDIFLARSTSRFLPFYRVLEEFFYKQGCTPYIFGGMIRDVGLHKEAYFHSDVDVVFEGVIDLSKISASVEKNKYGGYRTFVEGRSMDFWRIEDTWAFRNGVVQYEGVDSILETTQTNFESVLYDVKRRVLRSSKSFVEGFFSGYLTLVNKVSLDEEKLLFRVVSNICNAHVEYCDQSVASFVGRFFSQRDLLDVYNGGLVGKVPYADYCKVVERLLCYDGDMFPVDVRDLTSYPQRSLPI